jgi:hypothetical protein
MHYVEQLAVQMLHDFARAKLRRCRRRGRRRHNQHAGREQAEPRQGVTMLTTP